MWNQSSATNCNHVNGSYVRPQVKVRGLVADAC